MSCSSKVFDSELYEVKFEKAIGMYAIVPIKAKNPYMIVFTEEYRAKEFCVGLAMGQYPDPELNPTKYRTSGEHPDGFPLLQLK